MRLQLSASSSWPQPSTTEPRDPSWTVMMDPAPLLVSVIWDPSILSALPWIADPTSPSHDERCGVEPPCEERERRVMISTVRFPSSGCVGLHVLHTKRR
eukprot:2429920-Rhodomonas_salina.1